MALQMSIKALALKGEIITTPYSFVATTSSIVWEGCKPVFVDINEYDLNINPKLIESVITSRTVAILATHIYGNPSAIDQILMIAKKYKLEVIFDAAHCFGTKYKGQSVMNFGDISTVSFNATKIFSTVEGGAIVTNNPSLQKKLALIRNFGRTSPHSIEGVGINGKNSEFHAAMGLSIIGYMDEVLKRRKEQYLYYQKMLKNLNVSFLRLNPDGEFNYSYLPIIFQSEEELENAIKALNKQHVFPRRYFYPSLNTLGFTDRYSCPISEDISRRVLTLPLHHDLTFESIDMICEILLKESK